MNNLTKEEIRELSNKMFVVSPMRSLVDILPNLVLYQIHRNANHETESAFYNSPIGICFINSINNKETPFTAKHRRSAKPFSPTIYEVLSSMPQELVEKVKTGQYNAVHIIPNGLTEDKRKYLSEVFLYNVRKAIIFAEERFRNKEAKLNLGIIDVSLPRGGIQSGLLVGLFKDVANDV